MEKKVSRNEVLNYMVSSAIANITISGSYWNMVAISETFGEYAKNVPYSTSLSIFDGSYGIEVSFLWIPKKPFGHHNGPDCTEFITMKFNDRRKTVWTNDKSTRRVLTDDFEQVQNIINDTINEHLDKLRNSKDKHLYSEEWLSGHRCDIVVRCHKN